MQVELARQQERRNGHRCRFGNQRAEQWNHPNPQGRLDLTQEMERLCLEAHLALVGRVRVASVANGLFQVELMLAFVAVGEGGEARGEKGVNNGQEKEDRAEQVKRLRL